jgi:hypothetical protein
MNHPGAFVEMRVKDFDPVVLEAADDLFALIVLITLIGV